MFTIRSKSTFSVCPVFSAERPEGSGNGSDLVESGKRAAEAMTAPRVPNFGDSTLTHDQRIARRAEEKAQQTQAKRELDYKLMAMGAGSSELLRPNYDAGRVIPDAQSRVVVGSSEGYDTTLVEPVLAQTGAVSEGSKGPDELKIYRVEKGDTLGAIAGANDISLAEILRRNPGINPNLIKPGQVINISGEAPAATAQAPAATINRAPASRPATAPRVAATPATAPRVAAATDRPRGDGEVQSYATQLEQAKKNLTTALESIANPSVTNKEPYTKMKEKAEAQIKALEPLAKQELAEKEAQERYAKLSPNYRLLADYSESLRLVMKKRLGTPSNDPRQVGWRKEEIQLRGALESVNTLVQNDEKVAKYKGEIRSFGNRADRGPQTAELNIKIQELEGKNKEIIAGLNKVPDPLNPTRLAQLLHPNSKIA